MSASVPTPEPHKFRDTDNTFKQHPDGISRLEVCPRCHHDRMQVEVVEFLQTKARQDEFNGADLIVNGYCPDCNLRLTAGISQEMIDAFRVFHTELTKSLMFSLADQTDANNEAEIAAFRELLDHDIIIPEDF